MSIIYVITNQINLKQYVGKTSFSLEKRFQEHIYDSHRNDEYTKHRPLYMAFKKYGIENFSIKELEQVPDEQADEREKYWISYLNTYNNGYNATLGGDGQIRIDKAKVLQLYHEGYNNTQIAKILGHERATISKLLNSLGLKSNHIPLGKQVILIKENKKYVFNTQREAAQFLIDNHITRSKKIDVVSGCIYEAIKTGKLYFGYKCLRE